MPREWARRAKIENVAEEAADLLIEWVRRYNYGETEIRVLLHALFSHAVEIARATGAADGAARERETNPAIKSVGAAVAGAADDRRQRALAIACAFQTEAARGNPFYAFNEALKVAFD